MKTVKRDVLKIVLEDGDNRLHQSFLIDSIEVTIHYNRLVDLFFMTIYVDNEFVNTNLIVLPNHDMFLGYKFEGRESTPFIGTLVFACNNKIKKIGKENLFKDVEVFYFKEVTEAIPS